MTGSVLTVYRKESVNIFQGIIICTEAGVEVHEQDIFENIRDGAHFDILFGFHTKVASFEYEQPLKDFLSKCLISLYIFEFHAE